MHMRTITKPVNTDKLQRALFILETLSDANSEKVLEALKSNQRISFLDLMVQTGLDSTELRQLLEKLHDAQAIEEEEDYRHVRFFANEGRLSGIMSRAKALARGSKF